MKKTNFPKVAEETSLEAPDVVSPLGKSFNKKEYHKQYSKKWYLKHREYYKKWHSENYLKNKEKYKIYQREYRNKNKDMIFKRDKKYRNKNKEIYIKASKKYVLSNENKIKAHNIVHYKKLKKEPCFICKSTINIHAHHPDYSKPLYVYWLCCKCHKYIHRLLKIIKEFNNAK